MHFSGGFSQLRGSETAHRSGRDATGMRGEEPEQLLPGTSALVHTRGLRRSCKSKDVLQKGRGLFVWSRRGVAELMLQYFIVLCNSEVGCKHVACSSLAEDHEEKINSLSVDNYS